MNNSLDVIGLLDNDNLIGYRLSTNYGDTYDMHKNTLESICRSYNLNLVVSSTSQMKKLSSGVLYVGVMYTDLYKSGKSFKSIYTKLSIAIK